ncbi:MAG: efflux RND transporter periplasmic adaptor subunit [Pirellulales bacterium]
MSLFQHWSKRLAQSAGTIAIVAAALGLVVAVLVIWAPRQAADEAVAGVWTCSMHPDVRLPGPGPCPKCGMPLIPVSRLESEQQRVDKQAGLETAVVNRRELFKDIRAAGKFDYNERRVAYITARIDGRIDRVYADVTGVKVKAGDHLVDIYSPNLYVAQGELITAINAYEQRPNDRIGQSLIESARTKLRLLGVVPEQIAQIEQSRKYTTHLTIYAPIGGVIVEKNVREQQYVDEGDMLYRIADLDPIWLYLDIYERDLGWVRHGQLVEVTVEAYPGEQFTGKVVFIDPFLNDQTRAVRVRVNLENPEGRLKPAMYASAAIHVQLQSDGGPRPTGLEGKYICPMHPEIVSDSPGRCSICEMPLERVPDHPPLKQVAAGEEADVSAGAAGQALAVPKSAVLDTGRRQVAFRKNKDGAYELVELKLGPLAESKDEAGRVASYYPVLAGLRPADEVVVEGAFLLDSQRQIEGMPSLLYAEGQSGQSLHAGHGDMKPPDAPKQAEHKH